MVLTLTSDVFSTAQLYDVASTIMAQRISQLEGVGQVSVGGGASPAMRIEVDPTKLANFGLAMSDVRAVLQGANSNLARGQIEDGDRVFDIVHERPARAAGGVPRARSRRRWADRANR